MTNQSAFPSTFQPTQSKREVRKDVLGGIVGGLEETAVETFQYITGDYPIINEGPVRGQTLENLSGLEAIVKAPSFPGRGEMSGFQTPRLPEKSDAQLIAEQQRTLRNFDIVAEANNIVENYQAKISAEDQVRLEIAGMPDEELATEGNYQAGYRGPSLKKIYNTMWIFFKRVATKLNTKRDEVAASITEIRNKAKKGFVMRQGELQMGTENQDHFTKHTG